MKKTCFICLLFLLFAALLLSGCGKQTPGDAAAATPTPAPTQAPTPTPTPEPTSIPYDLVAEESSARYSYLLDDSSLGSALESITGRPLSDYREESDTAVGGASMDDTGKKGDTVVSDGRWMYLLSDKDLVTVRMDGENSCIVSKIRAGISWSGRGEEPSEPVSGYEKTPSGLYLSGNRLVVTSDWYGYDNQPGDFNYTEYTAVDVYDVDDPTNPRLLGSFGQSGSVAAAGVKDDLFYLVTDCPVYDDSTGDTLPVPDHYFGGNAVPIPLSKIICADDGYVNGYAFLSVYDLKGPGLADSVAMLGAAADVFAEDGRIILYCPRIADSTSRSIGGKEERARITCTDLYEFSADGGSLALKNVSTVNGVITDSGCMDLYDGTLRCLTQIDQRLYTSGDPEQWDERIRGTAVYLLDEGLNTVGKISGDPEAAQIRWIGFLGEKAVLTMTDDSSVVADMLDPPEDVSALPKVGEVEAVAIRSFGENGYTAFYRSEARKLRLTIYDGKMAAMDSRDFGSDHSSTLENVHGYMADGIANIIAFSADDSYCFYGFDKKEGLYFRSSVFLDDWAWNARGYRSGEYFYVADTKELVVLSVPELAEISRIYF